MHTRRFGRKLKLPSTVAIKHAILRLMVQNELKAQAPAAKVEEVLVAYGPWRREDAKRNQASVLNTVQCIWTNDCFWYLADVQTDWLMSDFGVTADMVHEDARDLDR